MNITDRNEKRLNLISIAVICISLILSVFFDGIATANEVRNDCLRLHILADSDESDAQNVKLAVRDALLDESSDLFIGTQNVEKAVQTVLENKSELEAVAEKVLKSYGFEYNARIVIEKEYFPTREYDGIKLPAGEYTACKVILGSGNGHNWWCIMFPPLCLPAAERKDVTEDKSDSVYAVFGNEGTSFITETNGYKIKFRIVEIFEEAVNRIKNRQDA